LAFITVITATTIAAGLPAYLLVRQALKEQAWARVAAGRRATLAVLESEQANMVNLAFHTAQRPTIQNLVLSGELKSLEQYLDEYILGVGLDFIVISDASNRALASSPSSLPVLSITEPGDAQFYVEKASAPGLVLAASQFIPAVQEPEFIVTIGKYLDQEFVEQLASETWFEQSILINGKRISTSLQEPTEGIEKKAPAQALNQGGSNHAIFQTTDLQYYTVQLPITDPKENMIAVFEIALPVSDLAIADRNAIRILVLSTTFVISIGSVVAYLYANRLSAPLKELTNAAQRISSGDYSKPIPVLNEPYEITLLASTFEQSRINTAQNLEKLIIEKTWSNTLIQSISEGIVVIDNAGKITTFNKGAASITGWKEGEALFQPIDQILPLKDGQGVLMDCVNWNSGQTQITIFSKGHEELTLSVNAVTINYPNTKSEHTLLVLRNITEEIASDRIRSYFLANISHEFRTPLSALKASVELLVDEIEDVSMSEIVELLSSIHYSVTGLQTLIDNLLESTSIEAGKFQIRRQPTDFNKVISDSVRIMRPLLNRRHQSLECYEPSEIPPVMIDPTRLTQVMVNLLSNASKYSPVEEQIELNLQILDNDTLRVSVADHGPGIPLPNRKNIFSRFVRLDSRDGSQYGVGLGLSVVKTIVEEHGGKVGIEDCPGGGATFWFTIPLNGGVS
jgi:PAS domain S-box-containing protein